MAVRNWWIEVEIDGRKHRVEGGPRAKDGGFSLVGCQREGTSVEVLTARGIPFEDGRLQLVVRGDGYTHTHTTER